MFGVLTQSLFKNMTHSGARASLKIDKLTETASIQRVRGSATLSKQDQKLVQDKPLDVRTIYRIFNLDPEITVFATCPEPACCAIYRPTPSLAPGGINQYPLHCTKEKFGKVCESLLAKNLVTGGRSVQRPLRPFPYHHFNDHVAEMLSRPGIEDAIESYMNTPIANDELRDVIHSPGLRDLLDADGLPFLRVNGTELRLVWGLSVDWYNPFFNKAAGKSVSMGLISMICYNLPPALRTQENNIYLAGIIPAPQEPSVDATNNFLEPLVSDLKTAYNPGVRFSRTYKYPSGRDSRSALVPVIADIMASKKVTGHVGHRGTYFCSRCRLPLFEIDNLDMETWPPGLTPCQHRELANEWLSAPTKAKQAAILKKNGIRWSVLLELEYWRPAQWTVMEAMHILLLGLIPYHCRDLLGLSIKDLDNQEADISPEAMRHARAKLADGSHAGLKSLPLKVLKQLCVEQCVLPLQGCARPKKNTYISALLGVTSSAEHVTNYDLAGFFDEEAPVDVVPIGKDSQFVAVDPQTPMPSARTFLTKNILEEIREGITSTIRPSFQATLPHQFGSKEHGKLKADQWRTAMEFDIPVSFVRILENRVSTGNISEDKVARRVVEHTLDLAMALAWGLSRKTSARHIEKYRFYMERYLTGILELYPHFNLKPKHHYALHVVDMLEMFGPLHGTWAFAFERLVGRLQGFNLNYKIGEMENTIMSMFCRRSRLLSLLAGDMCPPILQDAWAMMKKDVSVEDLTAAHPPISGMPRTKSRGVEHGSLQDDIFYAFMTLLFGCNGTKGDTRHFREVSFHHWHTHSGVLYSDFHTSSRHSLIYFQPSSQVQAQARPAEVRAIFSCKYRNEKCIVIDEVFFAVHEFQLSGHRAFAPFGDFRADIYHLEPNNTVQVIRATQVSCPANQQPWSDGLITMRAVDREY